MATAGPEPQALLNLTPHSVQIYDETGSKVVLNLESRGALRVRSAPQTRRGKIGEAMVITGQRMVGLDEQSAGYKVFTENPWGSFVVSMATAQWLVQDLPAGATFSVYAPATGPGYDVRDAQQRIKGAMALEAYIVNGRVVA
jgi:hypothetical protein